MFIKTVIRQGNKMWEYRNLIKQYKEENQSLRNEISFRQLDKQSFIRNLKNIIYVGNTKKEHYVDILNKIQKELDNAANID